MSSCREIELYLSDYIEDNLGNDIRSRVEEHLLTCEQCREKVKDLQELRRKIVDLPRLDAPAGLLEGVHAKISKQSLGKRIGRILFHPLQIKIPLQLVSTAAVAALVILIINLHPASKQSWQQQSRISEKETGAMQETGKRDSAPKGSTSFEQDSPPLTVIQPLPENMEYEKAQAVVLTMHMTREKTRPKKEQDYRMRSHTEEFAQERPAPAAPQKAAPEGPASEGQGEALGKLQESKDREKEVTGGDVWSKLEACSKVRQLVKELHGMAKCVEGFGRGEDREMLFKIMLPAGAYQDFLQTMQKWALLKGPAPQLNAEELDYVQITLHLIPSR